MSSDRPPASNQFTINDPSTSEVAGSSEGTTSNTIIPRATSLATALDALLIEHPTSSMPSTIKSSGKHPSSSSSSSVVVKFGWSKFAPKMLQVFFPKKIQLWPWKFSFSADPVIREV
jgi:hypothetical protein